MSARPVSALIVDAQGQRAVRFAHCLGCVRGSVVHGISSHPRVPLRYSRFNRSLTVADVVAQPPEEAVALVLDVAKRTGTDIIAAINEDAVEFLSTHRAALSQRVAVHGVPSLSAFHEVVDKGRLAEICEESGIATPATVRWDGTAESAERIRALAYPALVKPTRAEGGRGIAAFRTPEEALRHLETQFPGGSPPSIVQTAIEGYDIDCSILCDQGRLLAYTIQRGIVSRGFAAPAAIEFLHDERVFRLVSRFVERFTWGGIAHLDLRYDEAADDVKLIEVNARYWGSMMGSLQVGVNFPYLACRTARGESFDPPQYTPGRYIATSALLRHQWQRVRGRSDVRFGWRQTDIPYFLMDPIGEIARMRSRIGA